MKLLTSEIVSISDAMLWDWHMHRSSFRKRVWSFQWHSITSVGSLRRNKVEFIYKCFSSDQMCHMYSFEISRLKSGLDFLPASKPNVGSVCGFNTLFRWYVGFHSYQTSGTIHDSITLLHLRDSITLLQDVTVLTSSHLHEIISSLQYTTVFFH